MKPKIHPRYVECTVTCGCGNSFETRATVPTLTVEICSACHPFYTGKQKFVDAAGRVEKFQRRHAWSNEQKDKLLTEKKSSRRAGREKVSLDPRGRKRKKGEEDEGKKDAKSKGAPGDAKGGDAKPAEEAKPDAEKS